MELFKKRFAWIIHAAIGFWIPCITPPTVLTIYFPRIAYRIKTHHCFLTQVTWPWVQRALIAKRKPALPSAIRTQRWLRNIHFFIKHLVLRVYVKLFLALFTGLHTCFCYANHNHERRSSLRLKYNRQRRTALFLLNLNALRRSRLELVACAPQTARRARLWRNALQRCSNSKQKLDVLLCLLYFPAREPRLEWLWFAYSYITLPKLRHNVNLNRQTMLYSWLKKYIFDLI